MVYKPKKCCIILKNTLIEGQYTMDDVDVDPVKFWNMYDAIKEQLDKIGSSKDPYQETVRFFKRKQEDTSS